MADLRKYHIILVPSELGCGKRGASHGPEAIVFADIDRGGGLFNRFPFTKVQTYNEELLHSTPFPYAKYADHILRVVNNIISEEAKCFERGEFPVIFSGDHSNAIGSVAGIKNYYPGKRLGVIWIDAHGDLHSPFTTPSGNVHGMPLGACLGEDYCSEVINPVDPQTVLQWKNLTHAGDREIHPKILATDVVLIHIRDLEKPEWNDIFDNKIRYFGPEDVEKHNMEYIAAETLQHLKDCDMIYISFDVDSMDPSVSSGTGTSSPNGMSKQAAKELLALLFASPKLVALEFTEVNPLLDTRNSMAQVVLEILDELFPA